jgi:nitrite reductase (NADH) large subunit
LGNSKLRAPLGLTVLLEDGRELAADLVVMAIGIKPSTELAKKADIHCERGIVVDDTMLTYDGLIHAVGECAHL